MNKNIEIKSNPQKRPGMILAFTLVILLLMSLMGIAILSNTRTEVSISGNSRVSKDAFNSADAAARIAVILSVALFDETHGENDLKNMFTTSSDARYPFTVEFGDKFDASIIQIDSLNTSYLERYAGADFSTVGTSDEPHLIFKVNDKVVATAVIQLEDQDLIPPGFAEEVYGYDKAGGSQILNSLVITINGSTLADVTGNSEEDPHTVITTMYRQFF
jgi:hypothetical protein